MKTFLRNNQEFIAVSPVPKHTVPDGLTIQLDSGVQMQCDLVAGRVRYDIPEEMRGHVTVVFIDEKGGT
jgi:hypothetical protein